MSMPFRSESSLFFVKGIPDLSFSSNGAARWKHSVYFFPLILKLINYSCSSYPTRASYSGQVDEFRNPMKTELKTRLSSAAVFSTRFSLNF